MNGVVHTNIYDKTDQLLSSSGLYTATYDAVGNRQTADGGTYTANSLNQYTQIIHGSTTNNLSYDGNGNVANLNGLTLEHDSQGQLVHARSNEWLSYDYRRLRVGASVELGYDEWENISTIYDAQGNLVERYDSWTYVDTQYAYADGIDEAVLVRTGDYYGQDLYAVVGDHLGSVVAIVNHSGTVTASGDYRPFGDLPLAWQFGDLLGTLGFTGREYDQNTGLYYYRNRWYSKELGRFLEPDPIGLAGWDVNLYRYVHNFVSSGTDPEGLYAAPIAVVGIVLILGVLYTGWKINQKAQQANAANPNAMGIPGLVVGAQGIATTVPTMALGAPYTAPNTWSGWFLRTHTTALRH